MQKGGVLNMSEETRSSNSLDQIEEVWKQWYETSSKVWSDILAGTRENHVDPYGLYRSWLKAVEDGQEAGDSIAALDPGGTWKKWFETTGDIWRQSQELGVDPLGMTTRWIEVMEEARQKLLNGVAIDPVAFFKQWYTSSNEIWSKALEEVIGTEKFVEAANRYMESYTTFYKTFRRLNEDYFSHLQLTTRADLARVAEIIVALDSKVDWIQDAFEDFQGQLPHVATLESIRMLANHLESLEDKLQRLPETLQKIDSLQDLSPRLTAIEGRLDTLPPVLHKLDALQGLDLRLSAIESKSGEIAPALQKLDAIQELDLRLDGVEGKLSELSGTLAKNDATGDLEKRLDGVENKLDQLLSLLREMGTPQPAPPAPARTPQRRASRAKSTPEKAPETEGATS